MDEFEANLTLIGLFALRCVAPLAVTLGIGYIMNRVVDRWESEEATSQERSGDAGAPAIASSRFPMPSVNIPCWLLRNCEPAAREDCPAYKHNGIPCWLARMRTEGALPSTCPSCPIYEQTTTVFARA